MPKADSTAPIDTSCFGKLYEARRNNGIVSVAFDTGIVMHIPELMFDRMVFELQPKEEQIG